MNLESNDKSEGPVTKAIEKQTAKVPSDTFFVVSNCFNGLCPQD